MGRKTKAEEMGLPKRLQKAFAKVNVGHVEEVDEDGNTIRLQGADKVLRQIWRIALDEDHPKQQDNLKWLADRYFGKEAKAIIHDVNVNSFEGINLTDMWKFKDEEK